MLAALAPQEALLAELTQLQSVLGEQARRLCTLFAEDWAEGKESDSVLFESRQGA